MEYTTLVHCKFKRVVLVISVPLGRGWFLHLERVVSTSRVVLTPWRGQNNSTRESWDSSESSMTLRRIQFDPSLNQITKSNSFRLITSKVAYTRLLFQLTISRRRRGDYKLTYSLSSEFPCEYKQYKVLVNFF